MREEILRIENVTRKIEGITYLDNINFHVFKGEIMGLIPLNNHGKRQLIELISQNLSINFGRIYFNEELVNYYEHSNMTNNKVYSIDKETKLVEDLKVTDNINVLNHTFHDYIIREKKLKTKTDELLKQLEIKIETYEYVSELSLFQKTVIELIKAVISGAQLIIFNELSSFLSIEELSNFQKLILYYTKRGISFLYMANHHEEAFKICDRVCLLENGGIIKVIDKKDFSDEILKPYIISFDNSTELNELSENSGIFEFRNFITENLKGISFSVKRSECITILDINNKGIQDIVEIFSGLNQPISGDILLDHHTIDPINANNLLINKVVFIPENPVNKTLFYDMSYLENLTFLIDRKLNKSIINRKILRNIKEEYRSFVGDNVDVRNLRGMDATSLYELVYFKIHIFSPKVVFIMQPFSDADMYLRGRIIELINKLKKKGIAVIILAVNISDTLTVSDRLLVMENGKLLRNYDKKDLAL
ncbi:monosaccharide ABC transporter ATP-binding protein, CUT2 family [Anaerovirgula multivorans]|uniref:Monosaccharide ABC transporter ATP-binding protein, CUT2 family n=1 Tax=Anaerovirgula multivorans TaxID=312168 RepID=A0A239D8M8_9FIRM|nr:ATP-binding cassette domain-containing protein [Anaerovirgula multivorans]SNS28378.1 monosaccharide ABC transporter ATP-binding protein, CUT2 family [Anaerovirgula multivorans]